MSVETSSGDERAAWAAKAVETSLRPTPHPLVPWLGEADLARFAATEAGRRRLLQLHEKREKVIRMAEDPEDGDPFTYGFELEHWQTCRRLFNEGYQGHEPADVVYVGGGKRATKSYMAARLVVKAAMKYPRGVIWCFQDNERTSIATQQQLVWHYLPKRVKELNGRRHTIYKVNYTQSGGFTERLLVLPNRTEIHFLTYNQDPDDFHGWVIGAPVPEYEIDPEIPNLAWWGDENMTHRWLTVCLYRSTTRRGKGVWTFSVNDGLTPTLEELRHSPEVLESRPAELLADRVNVKGVPKGHMPFIEKSARPRTYCMYFHTDLNPFPPNYDEVRKLCLGKDSRYVEMNAYGYGRKARNLAHPQFGAVHIIDDDKLPAEGTNYLVADPAGNRSWSFIWWRVAPGNPEKHYIYRDWPPMQEYGEWALPSERQPPDPDGDMGPAQANPGWGDVRLKRELLRREAVELPTRRPPADTDLEAWAAAREPDPYRRRLLLEAVQGVQPGEELTQRAVQEALEERQIDPRAGNSPKQAEQDGGTCIIWDWEKENRDPETGEVLAPPIYLVPASGVQQRLGIGKINDLLDWNDDEPFDPVRNTPQLFVARSAQQVIKCLEVFTGQGTEKSGWKDFHDLIRYGAMADWGYVPPGGHVVTRERKGY